VIADGEHALQLARQARSDLAEGSREDESIAEAAELLQQLLWQDIAPTERGYKIRRGTKQDRIPSVEDPEQRHGHKSQNHSFTGHNGQVAVEVDSQLITAVEVTPGNQPDGQSAQQIVEDSEDNAQVEAGQVIGDTAYGSMQVRKDLGEREVIAPTVKGSRQGDFSKDNLDIDVDNDQVTCPAGNTTTHYTWTSYRSSSDKPKRKVKRFAFAKEVCRACPHYSDCVNDKRQRGRFITLHPDEKLLQQARTLEKTEYFRQTYRQRIVVEHRIARLVGLGLRQSRYFGRAKTQCQALLAATVANLTLIANWRDAEGSISAFLRCYWRYCCARRAERASVAIMAAIMRPKVKMAPI